MTDNNKWVALPQQATHLLLSVISLLLKVIVITLQRYD